MISNNIKERCLPWLVCGTAALFFFYEFIQGNMFASMHDEIMKSYQLTLLQSGWLSSIYYLSNVVFLFPASLILDRYPVKRIIMIAMLVCVFGTFLFAWAENYYLALFCRFLTGIGSAFCFLSCVRLASRWFPSEHMAMVTGCIVTIAMLGGVVSQQPLTMLVTMTSWRQALVIDGLLGVVILALIAAFVVEKPKNIEASYEEKPLLSYWASLKYAYLNYQNILAALYTSLMNMPVAVLGAFIGSTYLMQAHHFMRGDASTINGMLFLGTIIGGPLIGGWSDKILLRRLPMLLCTVLSMFTVVFILYMPQPSVLMMEGLFFALGFFSSGQIISYALVAESAPLSMTATSLGVISVFTQGGFILYQNAFSYVMDSDLHTPVALDKISHIYQHALMLIPYGFVVAMLCAISLRETHSHRLKEQVL